MPAHCHITPTPVSPILFDPDMRRTGGGRTYHRRISRPDRHIHLGRCSSSSKRSCHHQHNDHHRFRHIHFHKLNFFTFWKPPKSKGLTP